MLILSIISSINSFSSVSTTPSASTISTAIAKAVSPIVVDRGNGLNAETARYARYAARHGYSVQLGEPDSPWWIELRVLLKFKQHVADELFDAWASKLSQSTRDGHRVPAATIRHWMSSWRYDLTVEEILNWEEKK